VLLKHKSNFNMNKKLLVTGSILGLISIILGAFASHGLEKSVTPDDIETFQVGVRYQMYHALFLLFVGIAPQIQMRTKKVMFYLVIVGVLFFSGSIYGLSTNELSGFDFKTIGFITPIGGLLLILSWIVMLLDFLKLKGE
jgi:uncharacterized membrane protein YgdD (TMEM256/DUF423 family)